MSLKQALETDMKFAMKSGNKENLLTLRLVIASIKNEEIKKKRELTDDEVVSIIQKEVKQTLESLSFMKHGEDGTENVKLTELQNRSDLLESYLPVQLTHNEIRELVIEVIESTATNARNIGNVMKSLMPHVKGKADGKVVKKIVEELI